MNLYKHEEIATLKARTSGTNIFLKWTWMNDTIPLYVKKTLVFYLQEGDSKVIILQHYENSSKTEYTMKNVPLDANYNICIRTIMTTKWPGVRDPQICTNVSNNRWEMSAFIGSTAGALLALILIILLVLMSKKVKKRQKNLKANMNQIPQRQRYDSAFESQFDSVAIREDTSFYDDLITSEVSYFDSSYRMSSDNSSSSNTVPSVANMSDTSCTKAAKKRTSLIEEESGGNQSCDSWMYTITTKHIEDPYQNVKEGPKLDISPTHPSNQVEVHIMETSIDEVDSSKIPNSVNICPKNVSPKTSLNKSPQRNFDKSSKLVTECLEDL